MIRSAACTLTFVGIASLITQLLKDTRIENEARDVLIRANDLLKMASNSKEPWIMLATAKGLIEAARMLVDDRKLETSSGISIQDAVSYIDRELKIHTKKTNESARPTA